MSAYIEDTTITPAVQGVLRFFVGRFFDLETS